MSLLTAVRPVGFRVSELGERLCALFSDSVVSSPRLDARGGEGSEVASGHVLSGGLADFDGVLRCGSKLRSCDRAPNGPFLLKGSVFS